jgi:hypothetical protein
MIRAFRHLAVPATESQLGIALAVSAVAMALMLWLVIWQTNVIVYQRDLIRWLWNAHIGGSS